MNQSLGISVVIATYNMPQWLEKVLWGYRAQSHRNFELIIADDGSTEPTRQVVERFQHEGGLPIRHLWHEDRGYQRQTMLNRAIAEASHDYILFTDGDCIPRADFLAVHARLAEPGRFLSGGYCKLSMELSEAIDAQAITSQSCFDTAWLRRLGPLGDSQARKLAARPPWDRWLDRLTPTGATFNNCNSSAWKTDLVSVNGYDERMQYGGADREIGERLNNYRIRGKQIRHRAVCLHLEHERGYRTQESWDRNKAIRHETRTSGRIETPFGIRQDDTSHRDAIREL